MEAPLVRILHDTVIAEDAGEAYIQGIRHNVQGVMCKKQNPHNPAVPS